MHGARGGAPNGERNGNYRHGARTKDASSLARSALVEAAAQLTRALDQIAALPVTPALRREQIKLQVALLHALGHLKGFAAPETKAAVC